MEIFINILIGFCFLWQINSFYSNGMFYVKGFKAKRFGEDWVLYSNPKKAVAPFIFSCTSLICGLIILFFSPHWVVTLFLGLFVLNTLNLSESKRNYLSCRKTVITYNKLGGRIYTQKSNWKEYLFVGPLWFLSGEYWGAGFYSINSPYKN